MPPGSHHPFGLNKRKQVGLGNPRYSRAARSPRQAGNGAEQRIGTSPVPCFFRCTEPAVRRFFESLDGCDIMCPSIPG